MDDDDGATVRGTLSHVRIPPGVRVRLIPFPVPSPLEAQTMRDHHQDGRALADTPKRGASVIYDDTAAATPMDSPAGYDLGTCDQKHQRMMAYQAQRIDDLAARVAHLEATIRDWSAGK